MNKISRILTLGAALGTTVLSLPSKAFAQVNIANLPGNYANLNKVTYGSIISGVISLLLGVAGIIAFIFLLWGGLQWILSGGDKEGTEKARKRITAALIGLAIVFSAYALIMILQTVFGVTLTTFTLPNFI